MTLPLNQILCGNTLDVLKTIPDNSINCIITSPPYWGLRDYGIKRQIGLETTLDLYIFHLLQITAELKRILRPDGTMFWNHADCYGGIQGKFSGWPDQKLRLKEKIPCHKKPIKYQKSLILQNYRLLLKLIDDQEWILRNIIIWNKPNHMPSSVKDRLTNSYEPIYFLTKSRKYYFNLDAIRIPHKDIKDYNRHAPFNYRVREAKKGNTNIIGVKAKQQEMAQYDRKGIRIPGQFPQGIHRKRHSGYFGANGEFLINPKGKNPGDVWIITTQPFKGAHFATFPERLVEPMIKAGCPEHGVVLDPFCGSGTTCIVAKKLNRNYIGIDIKPEYCKIANERINYR